MVEIVDIKNGRKQPDEDDFAGPQASIDKDELTNKAGTAEGSILTRRRKMASKSPDAGNGLWGNASRLN